MGERTTMTYADSQIDLKLHFLEHKKIILSTTMLFKLEFKIPEELNMPKETYSPLQAYRNSKLATLILAKQLASYLDKQNIMSVSCHPGVVKTLIWRGKYVCF